MTDDDRDVHLLPALLETCVGEGPTPLPTPAQRLSRGRRVRRRRQLMTAAAASAAVLAIGGLGSTLLDPESGRAADDRAPAANDPASVAASASGVEPSQDPRDAPTSSPAVGGQRLVSDQFPAAFDTDGSLVVERGWTVARRVDNPLGLQPPQASLGLVMTAGADTRWMLIDLSYGSNDGGERSGSLGTSAAADDPGKGYSEFDDWLAEQVAINGGPAVAPLVTVDANDELLPGSGAELVATRTMPVVPGYSRPGDRMVEVRRGGRLWFAIVRGHRGRADVVPVDADVLPAPTFAGLLGHLRDQLSTGEGLR